MPVSGACAWKEAGISPEERVDRFFNLIDHAVDGGISLDSLYSRKHFKEFILYTLHHSSDFCRPSSSPLAKDQKMPNLTVTNTHGSTVVVGDPGIFVVNVEPKQVKTVPINPEQLRLTAPALMRLAAAGWIKFSVDRTDAEIKTIMGEDGVKHMSPIEAAPPAPPAPVKTATPTPEEKPEEAPPAEEKEETKEGEE